MKPLFDCEVEYVSLPHLMQVYTGFFELQKKGIITLKIIPKKTTDLAVPVIKSLINKKYRVVYDTMDGFTWITGGIQENLEYFQKNYSSDFYFKRSYHKQLLNYVPAGCKIFPLGLNYNIHPNANLFFLSASVKDKMKYVMKTNKLFTTIFKKPFFYTKDFESLPYKYLDDKILFITRLWNPKDAKTERSKQQRQEINDMRVACIQACKKEFGNRFTGGVIMEEFSEQHYSTFLMPHLLTKKAGYLQAVKEHSICIATTGLHDSTGWKLSEYVAASRAIVSEPLKYEVPGDFSEGKNYFQFENPDQLLERIELLLTNKNLVFTTMQNNYYYYNNYLKPDNLILNTLFTIIGNS